jgi:hypothetical protein
MWKYRDLFVFRNRKLKEIGELSLIAEIVTQNPMRSEDNSQAEFLSCLFKRMELNSQTVNKIINQIFNDLDQDSLFQVRDYFLKNFLLIKHKLRSSLDAEVILITEIISKILRTSNSDIKFESLFSLETFAKSLDQIEESDIPEENKE